MERELSLLYLKTIGREPSVLEKSTYLTDLIAGHISLINVYSDLKKTGEYKQLHETNFSGDVDYDSSLNTITVKNINYDNYDGVIVANGKVGIKTGALPYTTSSAFITVKTFEQHMNDYNKNITNGFNFSDVMFIDKDQANIRIEEYEQRLNMYNGVFVKEYKISNIENSIHLKITHEIMALQQYPYCFLQNCVIENLNDSEMECDIYNVISNYINLENIAINNDIIQSTSILTSKGTDIKMNIDVFTNTMYLNNEKIHNKGIIEVDGKHYNTKGVRLVGRETTTLTMITGMMTTSDFPHPEQELIRILFSIKDQSLRVEHCKRWIDIWESGDIGITQKIDIPVEEFGIAVRETKLFQQHIKYALYNVFSIIRDDVSVDMNVLNLSVIDLDGEVFWNAEMFLIPILLLLRPNVARILLDFRFNQLDKAKSLAMVYGNEGSQFPYKNIILNYNDVYWDSRSPFYVFNTALIAINIWNYYRVSLDKYWLHEKGFVILQSTVRFFNTLFDKEFNMKEVLTINNDIEANNNLSKYLVFSVIKHYREACYALSFSIPNYVEELYRGLLSTTIVEINDTESVDVSKELPINVRVMTGNKDLVFYNNDTDELIGKRFGGYTGNVLKVRNDVDYTLYVEGDTFIKLYDENNNEIIDNEGTAIYSTVNGFTDGTVIIKNGYVMSYSNIAMGDYTFGKNAFVRETNVILNNIVKSKSNETEIYESYLILMNYYSKVFFSQYELINKTDIIQDNLIYNDITGNENDNKMINKLVKSNLECLLAQDVGLTSAKEYYINKFESTMLDIFDKSNEEMKGPWGNHKHYALIVFNILTSMIKLRIRGSINDMRFYTDIFGIDSFSGYVLPKYWNKVVVHYNKKKITIPNEYSKFI